jgi:nifR3 family TIM-barrel protein
MQNENMMIKVVASVIENSSSPVTAKIRSGWDENDKNAVEVAKKLESLGVLAITIHPRTRKQKYMGKADWNIIKKVKEAVNMPVIGSGDIVDGESAKKMLSFTGCDAIMIGRSAKGDPEIFSRIKNYLETEKYEIKNLEKQKNLFFEFLKLYEEYDNRGFNEIKTHALWFFKGFTNSKSIINDIINKEDKDSLVDYIKKL